MDAWNRCRYPLVFGWNSVVVIVWMLGCSYNARKNLDVNKRLLSTSTAEGISKSPADYSMKMLVTLAAVVLVSGTPFETFDLRSVIMALHWSLPLVSDEVPSMATSSKSRKATKIIRRSSFYLLFF